MKFKISPPVLYQAFISLMLISVLLPLSKTILFPYNLVGLILLVSGTYIAIDTKKMFKKTDTSMDPLAKPLKLHTNGIFRFTRNQMYLGITIGLLGIAILTGILSNFIFPILFYLLMEIIFIKHEEERLEKEFGEEYKQYKMKTRRWI
jgi:protein-S-isoprenylcysteine O-methyltransferase Ste14